VIVPTYNNGGTLKQVIDSLLDFTSNIIVVNDGSTDNTNSILSTYKNIRVISYSNNKGKGYALRQGFKAAVEADFKNAITIDSDGQHFAKDLPAFISTLEEKGQVLMIGARNMEQEAVPGKSSFGNKFSNFWFLVETGIKMPDTQSGFRLYPVSLLNDMIFFTTKFEFEIEVIVRAAWKGIKVVPVPVTVYYPPKGTRITHFRPFIDFTRISILNTILVILALLFFYPVKFIEKGFSKSTYEHFVKQIVRSEHSRAVTAISVGFGVFMGIVPLWGFQMLVAVFFAFLFRLNKVLVILFSNISIPPMIPLIVFLSYKLGIFWMGNKAVNFMFDRHISIETVKVNFIQYVYGSITLAVIAGLISGISSYSFLAIFKKSVAAHE
jgi:glycosyltransferase involved in cell wall biosynthesis